MIGSIDFIIWLIPLGFYKKSGERRYERKGNGLAVFGVARLRMRTIIQSAGNKRKT